MVEASCHCDAVVLELAEPPEDVFDCNCSICRRLGHWQAIDVPNPTRMGVNARLVDGLSAQNVRMHRLDGAGTGKFWS